MKIDCIADLHGFFPSLPGGDLLIVAGDLTARDTPIQHLDFIDWCRHLPYRKIIVVGGNHDRFLENLKSKYFGMPVYHDHCQYLCNSGTEFEKLKIWGTPHSLIFPGVNPGCTAFMGTEEELREKYDLIPEGIDILISHTPPYGILDQNKNGEHCGSMALRESMFRLKTHYLICGHIHEMGGKEVDLVMTKVINCSYVNEKYQPVNNPMRILI